MQDGTSKDAFAALVMERYKARNWPGTVTYNKSDFSLDLGFDNTWVNLGNIYADWLAAEGEAEKARTIEILVNSSFQAHSAKSQGFEEALPNILPAVRGRDFIDNLWMTAGDESWIANVSAVSRPFADRLGILLMVDTPDSMNTLTNTQLTDWGKTFDDILPLAMANLKRFKTVTFETVERGVYYLSTGDFYDASALLMPEIFDTLDIKGDVMAVVVSRTLVVVTGSTDETGQGLFARIAESEYARDPRAISLMPLILRKGAWQSATPTGGRYPVIDRLIALDTRNAYQGQKAMLDAYFKKSGRDTFVATFDLIEEGAHLTSFSTLTSGVYTLLPQTDVVILMPENMQAPMVRRWADLMAVHKPSIEPNTYPPRYIFPNGMEKAWAERLERDFRHPEGFPGLKPAGTA